MEFDAKKFYECDKREYILKENEPFLTWLYANIEAGYTPPLDLKELQRIIKVITTWYEFKYPFKKFKPLTGVESFPFVTDYMSDSMTMLALKYRLTDRERRFLECFFRMGVQDEEKGSVEFTVKEKFSNTVHHISIDDKTGALKNADLEFLNIFKDVKDELSIVEIYHTLRERATYDITELKSVHLHHKTDLRLRRRIFELINLALIYSKDATPELGRERAQMFSKEFSRYFHLDITPPELYCLPQEKPTKKITDTVKMMRLISKIDAKRPKQS